MNITVRPFARARDIVGESTLRLHVEPGATVADVRDRLVEQIPQLSTLAAHLLFAIGTEYVNLEVQLREGDELAVFPPVSGG